MKYISTVHIHADTCILVYIASATVLLHGSPRERPAFSLGRGFHARVPAPEATSSQRQIYSHSTQCYYFDVLCGEESGRGYTGPWEK